MKSPPHLAGWLVVLCMAIGPLTRADLRLLQPDDLTAQEVLATVQGFETALANGDHDRALALFDGDAAQRDVVEAMLALTASLNPMRQAMLDKFGHGDWEKQLPSDPFATLASAVTRVPVFVNGDRAAVPSLSLLVGGQELARRQGGWRLVTVRSDAHAEATRALRAWAKANEDARRGVAAGRFASAKAAIDMMESTIASPLRQFLTAVTAGDLPSSNPLEPARAPQTQPTTATVATTPPPDAWRAAMGKTLRSDEVARLFTTIPGLPRSELSPGGLWVDSRQAGVRLVFKLPGSTLSSVRLMGAVAAWQAYRGALPEGLRLDEPRADVERTLGAPEFSSGGNGTDYRAYYPDRGIEVEYRLRNACDPRNPLRSITLTPPDPAAAAFLATQRGAKNHSGLAMRLVDDAGALPADAVESLADPAAPPGTPAALRVSRATALDDADVEWVEPTLDINTSRPAMEIQFTAGGAAKLAAFSKNHIGSRAAITCNGVVLMAPRINGEMSRHVMVTAGKAPADEASMILTAQHLHALRTSLAAAAATQPARR